MVRMQFSPWMQAPMLRGWNPSVIPQYGSFSPTVEHWGALVTRLAGLPPNEFGGKRLRNRLKPVGGG